MPTLFQNSLLRLVLFTLAFIAALESLWAISHGNRDLSSAVLHLLSLLLAVLALASYFLPALRKEIFMRLFLLGKLILPALFVYCTFVVDALFYSALRPSLLQNIYLNVAFVIGILLFYLSVRYSNTTKTELQREFRVLLLLFLAFVVLWEIIKLVETPSAILPSAIKLGLAVTALFIGFKTYQFRLKFAKAMALIAVLLLIKWLV